MSSFDLSPKYTSSRSVGSTGSTFMLTSAVVDLLVSVKTVVASMLSLDDVAISEVVVCFSVNGTIGATAQDEINKIAIVRDNAIARKIEIKTFFFVF